MEKDLQTMMLTLQGLAYVGYNPMKLEETNVSS